MAYPVAAGVTSHSGTLTPEIWSGKTLVKFYKSTVFGAIANTDYEGELKAKGDTVIIRTVPDITIKDYVIDQNLTYERPVSATVELLIDKGKYYAMSINDVEKLQSDLNYVDKWTTDAGQQLAIAIDYDILSNVYSSAAAANKGATAGADTSAIDLGATGAPESVDKTNILDYIVNMGTVLDEQSVPDNSRWIVFPPIFCGMIKMSDLKDASLSGDGTSILRNGRIGMIDTFEIYKSRQIHQTTDGVDTVHDIIAGHPSAITFASQLTKTETLKNPNDFGDLMRGLQIYGHEVIKKEALIHFYAKKA